ncbi:unnamed protein product [Caenorhabditis auriculariae]|uniref:Uncharacterized protein n=1 Tax=Caenorhabditis auriculariae TaxID=2777116 RepID=A0A8S1HBR6_9PELO|nr:unnamed protein product [Caenorhabditis auriculariae]
MKLVCNGIGQPMAALGMDQSVTVALRLESGLTLLRVAWNFRKQLFTFAKPPKPFTFGRSDNPRKKPKAIHHRLTGSFFLGPPQDPGLNVSISRARDVHLLPVYGGSSALRLGCRKGAADSFYGFFGPSSDSSKLLMTVRSTCVF